MVREATVELSRLGLAGIESDEEGGSARSILAVQAMAFCESCGFTLDGLEELRLAVVKERLKARRAEPQVFALGLATHDQGRVGGLSGPFEEPFTR
jgi:hypothetical protein